MSFGSAPAQSVNIVNANTIVAVTPAHSVGVVDVTVTTAGGSSSLNSAYTFLAPIESVTPSSAPKGSSFTMTIFGAEFLAGATVGFENGTGPVPQTSPTTSLDINTITTFVTIKSGGPNRNRTYDVRVTNPGGSSFVLQDGFTVTP